MSYCGDLFLDWPQRMRSYPAHAGCKDDDTGRRAAAKITSSGKKQTLEDRVFSLFLQRSDWTPDEVAERLGLHPGDIRPRFSELCLPKFNSRREIVRPALLFKTSETRESSRQNPQNVYRRI